MSLDPFELQRDVAGAEVNEVRDGVVKLVPEVVVGLAGPAVGEGLDDELRVGEDSDLDVGISSSEGLPYLFDGGVGDFRTVFEDVEEVTERKADRLDLHPVVGCLAEAVGLGFGDDDVSFRDDVTGTAGTGVAAAGSVGENVDVVNHNKLISLL